MIIGSAFFPAGHPADLPVTGGRTSVVFGETLCLPTGRQAAPLLVQLRERIASETISQLHNPGNPFVWRPAVQGFGEGHTGRAANLECVPSRKEGIAPMASKPDDAKSGLR